MRRARASWYRAHNASIVAAYLEHRALAERENRAERFFINVVLLRVLYAHALVAAPQLALGRMGRFSRPLGDPRVGMAGIFLSLRRTVPAAYPLPDPLERYLRDEAGIGRTLDYVVIRPRLQRLYEWSAAELDTPRLCELIDNGAPVYAWPVSERVLFERPLRPGRPRALPGAYLRSTPPIIVEPTSPVIAPTVRRPQVAGAGPRAGDGWAQAALGHPRVRAGLDRHPRVRPRLDRHPRVRPRLDRHPRVRPRLDRHPRVRTRLDRHPRSRPRLRPTSAGSAAS